VTDQDTSAAVESWEGQVLGGHYRVGELLGTGLFGRVYEGHHTSLAQRVAIKVFRTDVVALAGGPDRVLVDAKAASRIHHRNIVDVHEIGRLADTVYVATELVLGRTLHAFLVQAGRLPWSHARGVALQVAAALKAAHKRNVLHRGLRAANCFVLEDLTPGTGELRLKVSDFGFAHAGLAGGGRGEEHTSPFVGDAAYTAPEVARGDGASVRSDIYAFGVLLYRMLAGALPFEGRTPYQVLAAHVERPVPPLREKVRSISAEVEAIVLRTLAKDPSERFESVRELELALEEVSAQATSEPDEAAPSAALEELVTGHHVQAQPLAAAARDDVMHAAFDRRDEPGELPTSMFDRQMMVPYFGPTDAPEAAPEPTIQLGLAMLAEHALELPKLVASGLPQLMPGVRPAESAFPQLMSSVQSAAGHGRGAVADPTMLLGNGVAAPRLAGGPHRTNDELDGPTLHHPIRGAAIATEHLTPRFAGASSTAHRGAAHAVYAVAGPSAGLHAQAPVALQGVPMIAYGRAPAGLHAAPGVGYAVMPAASYAPMPAVAHATSTPVSVPPTFARPGAPSPRPPARQHPPTPAPSTISVVNVLITGVAVALVGALIGLAITCPSRRSTSERASSLYEPLGEPAIAGHALTSKSVAPYAH